MSHLVTEAEYPSRLRINGAAIAANLRTLRQHAPTGQMMAIIKADAYGHGASLVAQAAIAAGANWLGQAQVGEALSLHDYLVAAQLRDKVRIFSWIVSPLSTAILDRAVAAQIDLSASNLAELDALVNAGKRVGQSPRVHLKIDVGHSRAGFTAALWPEGVAAARAYQQQGLLQVAGIWSHLSCADDPSPIGMQQTKQQIGRFEAAVALAAEAGFTDVIRHLSATPGGLWHPESHYDMIRWGIGMYGYSPNPQRPDATNGLSLQPVMTLEAPLLSVKRIKAGAAVSYNATWVAPTDRWIGLVPLGYGDGIPRAASNRAEVVVHTQTGDQRVPLVGRVCMDQFMIDLGEVTTARRGDWVTLLGAPDPQAEVSVPTADDWAAWCDTINYEVMTRLGARIPRVLEPAGVQ
ncbi:alanine racemase [Boudabousia marimammalium]|uniref:Alanine racemase n=1 Tax=Boudabousia marimammalium TaxID=156892 RepID=A0A1Q5PJJ8_9ACTO|nr:alanine racemase [Boudabousia marimammalium]OKL46054.1 alanine racemase [Boudabousia marimammalium]